MKSANLAGETTIEMLAVSLVREYLSRKVCSFQSYSQNPVKKRR